MFELRHRTINGHRLAYRMEGQGQDLLLIHGLGGSSSSWADAMKHLAQRYRVLAPDLLGHGQSDKPAGDYSLGAHASFLRDLLSGLGIHRTSVVGHSFGGGIAMQFSYQHPELCDRIVLVASGGLGRELHRALRLLAIPGAELALPLIAPAFVRDHGNALFAWMRDRGIRAPRLHEGWQAYASLADPDSRRAFVRELRSVADRGGQVVSANDRLHHAATHPTLIVWGDRDRMIPVDHARAAHAALPESRLEIFQHVGHFPHAEDPQRFAEVVIAFVESTRRQHTRPPARRTGASARR